MNIKIHLESFTDKSKKTSVHVILFEMNSRAKSARERSSKKQEDPAAREDVERTDKNTGDDVMCQNSIRTWTSEF